MTITLHYAEKNLQGDIPSYEFRTPIDFFAWVDSRLGRNKLQVDKDIIYLLSFYDDMFNDMDLTFVSEYPDFILDIITNTHSSFNITEAGDIFLQEYGSFEEAYAVALSMKETHPLCYEPDHNLN